jgi:hypothetical protein
MTSEAKTWETLKADYIRQVTEVLSSVKHPRAGDILEDVSSHLDQRFAELAPDRRTWENLQAIITEMGPASDYAELLDTGETPTKPTVSRKYLLVAVLLFIAIAAAMIILPMVISDKERAYQLQESGGVEDLGHPFVNDPDIIGFWKSVDFVQKVGDFDPTIKVWKGDLFLKDLRVFPDGRTSLGNTWTKDWIWHRDSKIKAQYKIKEINGQAYLFLPWLSGDVTIRGQKPRYYVLKKFAGEDTTFKKDIQPEDEKAISAAIDSAQNWLKLVDEQAYGRSWDEAAEYFKKALTKDQWQNSLQTVRQPLGKAFSREIKSTTYTTQAPGAPDGRYVIIQFETSFENKKFATETVTPMLDKDGSWRVSGYYIK